MTLDQRLSDAMQHIASDVTAPSVDVAVVRSAVRRRRVRVASVALTTAAAVALAAATTLVGGRDTSAPLPASDAQPTTSSTMPSTMTFTSSQYDLTLEYPFSWTAFHATRDWTWETDVRDALSPAHDWFQAPEDSPAGDIRVSVWAAPLDADTSVGSTTRLMAWVEDYCTKSDSSPCSGIAARAVDLCVDKRDCHPGLLVPFQTETLAFFSGGPYGQDAVTIVAVWRPEWDSSVRPYGGARHLLESFLSTMDVWPNTQPTRP